MAILKRTLLASIPLLVICYLAATWITGSRIESLITDNNNKLLEQLPYIKISDRKFERGLFRSKETAKVTLNFPGAENIQFTLKSTIKNGPIPGITGIAAAVVDSQLSLNEGFQQVVANWMKPGVVLTAHTIYKFGDQENLARIAIPGFSATNLTLDEASLTVNFSNDLSQCRFQGDLPLLEMRLPGGLNFKVAGFQYNADQKQVFGDDQSLYGGMRKMSIAQVEFNPAYQTIGAGKVTLPWVSAKEIVLSDTTTLVSNEFLDYAEKGSAKTLEINSQDYGPARLDFSVGHLHARTLSDLLRKGREAMNQPSAATLTPQQAMQRQELIKHGLEFKIDQLSFTTPQGEASLSSSVKFNDLSQIDFSDKAALARSLNMKTVVSVPEEYVHSLQNKYSDPNQPEQFGAAVQNAIDRGYAVRNGAKLESVLELKDNQVTFNGIPYVAPPVQVAKVAPGADMPPLAKALNCAACHSIDRRIVGPAWRDVSRKYRRATQFEYSGIQYPLVDGLVMKVSRGGSGHWGAMPMPPNDPSGYKKADITKLILFVLSLENAAVISPNQAATPSQAGSPNPARPISVSVPPFHLGDSLQKFMAQLKDASASGVSINPHTKSADHEQTMIVFTTQGISLFFNNDSNLLETVRFDPPYSGKVGGVGIGDNSAQMLSSLGSPVRPPWKFADSSAYLFKDGQHSIRYDVRDGFIHTIFMLDR